MDRTRVPLFEPLTNIDVECLTGKGRIVFGHTPSFRRSSVSTFLVVAPPRIHSNEQWNRQTIQHVKLPRTLRGISWELYWKIYIYISNEMYKEGVIIAFCLSTSIHGASIRNQHFLLHSEIHTENNSFVVYQFFDVSTFNRVILFTRATDLLCFAKI